MLDALHVIESEKQDIISWIYSMQVLPNVEGNVVCSTQQKKVVLMGRKCVKKLPVASGFSSKTIVSLSLSLSLYQSF